MNDANTNIHQPFTVEENIRQLSETDALIVHLMSHTSTALNALTVPPTSTSLPDAPTQKEAFHAATDAFLDTLHEIDVKMKRQIMALEEAGIVDLSDKPKAKVTSLKPDGMGRVGNLDAGWLNSRGSRNERDMEAELWAKAREFAEKEMKTRTED